MAKAFKMQVKGVKELDADLLKIQLLVGRALDKALLQEMQALDSESNPLVPVDTSTLVKSRNIRQVSEGYTFGYYTEYALEVHEDVTRNYRAPGTQGKYLQQPWEKRLRDLSDRIKDSVLRRLKLR